MKIDRRRFLQMAAGLMPLLGPPPFQAAERQKNSLRCDHSGNVFLAPDAPREWPAFRTALADWREQARSQFQYRDTLYRRAEFAWAASNYACCFLMLCDETFYDRRTGRYAVDEFVHAGQREFGGYDSVVLWHAYPRIGVDQRNQFDFYRDMPGGLHGLRLAVGQFHHHGVRVYLDYNPWDTGTRREPQSDLGVLAELVRTLDADGIFLDTMSTGATEFRAQLDAARPGVILEGEGATPLEHICDHHASWAQEFGDSYAPGVLKQKWFERRHMQHQIRRWSLDHSAELHAAWMNGSGIMIWENVFGSWIPWNQRDRSILRAMLPIQRRFRRLFAGDDWTPLVPVEQPGVFASLWQDGRTRLWTLVNRTQDWIKGPLLHVRHEPRHKCYDLIAGGQAAGQLVGEEMVLSAALPPRGIGCFLSCAELNQGKDFDWFCRQQAKLQAKSQWDPTPPTRSTHLLAVPTARTKRVPAGMLEIPAATLDLHIEMRVRECGFYESIPAPNHPLADSYGFRLQAFHRRVALPRFAIDEAPVTNRQFAEFLKITGYQPKHPENFLKHWQANQSPTGQEDHPVVYVSLDDARAYARWLDRRLPTEEEWQYAAQGTDARIYPWGNVMEPGRCNDGPQGGTTAVRAFPQGRSPFGGYDMCGNVWHWTESERSDGRTQFCIIRGGAWFAAKGSGWYVDGGPRPANFATKFLLTWPGLDRCSTIGFRCAADLF